MEQLNMRAVVMALKEVYDNYNQLWIRAEQDDLSAKIKKQIVQLNHGISNYITQYEAEQKAEAEKFRQAAQVSAPTECAEVCKEASCNGAAA